MTVLIGALGSPGISHAAQSQLDWPTGKPVQVLRPFDKPAQNWLPGHRGVDLAHAGSIRAPMEGTIRYAGILAGKGVVSIDHGNGLISSFEPVEALVQREQRVRRGDLIGTTWEPSRLAHCAGTPCVHFGLRLHGEYVNPLLYLRDTVKPVRLLPLG